MSRIRQVSTWGHQRRTIPDSDCEIGKNLNAFTPDDMRIEIAIVHGIYLPAPFVEYADDIYSARIADDEIKNFWWTVTGDAPPPTELYLNIVRNGEPGYSWYVDDKPGSTCYMERGGGCLFMETLADACETLEISAGKLTAPSKDDDDCANEKRRFADNLMSIRRTLWLAFGDEEKRMEVIKAEDYRPFVFDLLSTLEWVAIGKDPMTNDELSIRVYEALQHRVGGKLGLASWMIANGGLTADEAQTLQTFADEWDGKVRA